MKSSSAFFSTIALCATSAFASFPGSTFGLVYNTPWHNGQVPASGHLTTFKTCPAHTELSTTISYKLPDLGAFFTVSGVTATLNNACSNHGIGVLAPLDPPVEGLDYALQWTTQPLSSLPEGTITSGFSLGPSPAFDELQNSHLGQGTWKLVRPEHSDHRRYILGWSHSVEGGIPVILNKIASTNVTCST
ncbi:hypothetical protein CVT24_009946 [Panaeolus cyanescens]|uniref:Uncharacterized protein n=1 Tax=Panaeolus cyanescens TaxID=181874 RepID=A0A409VXI5_9AGAR|nr:hypothetical protein CVT24_009946 [Panaeolus cyanescens]